MIATQTSGCAMLRFARRGHRTRLVASRVTAPAALVRPFELPDGRVLVQLVTIGPGLCAGDAIAVDVIVEDGAEVVVTTTAATRVMSMAPGEWAQHHVRLRAARLASLEYYPALAIPFPGAALKQTLEIDADASSRIGVVESWALGRSARDEYLRFRALSSRTSLAISGKLTYTDALHLEPGQDAVENAGVLDGRRYLAAGVFFGIDAIAPSHTAEWPPDSDVALALSRPGLAYLRALTNDAPALEATVQASLDLVAQAWRRPAVRFERFRC